MSPTFWTVTAGIGVAQGFFLVVALLLRRSANRRAVGALMGVVGVFATMTALELSRGAMGEETRLFAIYLGINAELLIGPLVLLFVRALLDPDRSCVRRDALHALPFLIGLAAWVAAWALVADRTRPFGMELDTATARYVAMKAVVFGAYVLAVFRELQPALRSRRTFSVGRRKVEIRWLAYWLAGGASVAGVIYLSILLEHQGVALPFEPDQLGALLLTGVIYCVSLALIQRPWFLSLRPQPAAGEPWHQDVAHLEACLDRRRPWLDPELGLEELAATTGFTESRLSTLINEGLATSFYGLLSRYRLAEFERLARDPALRDRTVLDLALRAGFNSKASFYRKFREAHGTTPRAWREQVVASH